ncbi:MAG: nickel/cobalt efflux transporter RcnA [Candidatus Latescibacteria bacterium]|nr:nickel/cobalt efflux transporter RcnA [Candidatus Latescibacterota bacterium]
MPDFLHALQSGATHLWLFIPAAILLGALHGLEPGHSKTMMAAFIVAIRGTIGQATLLGLSAAISHSLIIWMLAAAALHYGSQWDAEQVEPLLQLGSAAAILALALWMYVRTRRELRQASDHHHHHHHGHHRDHDDHHDHDDDHHRGFQDAHERAHAQDILQRFGGRPVTTPQIVLFGITGGLMPCPAAFTVLLVCLQLKRVTLGFAMVGAFSFGLALTMVATGALAAWSVQHAQQRFRGFGEAMRRAPYVSCIMLVVLASYMAWQGWQGLHP